MCDFLQSWIKDAVLKIVSEVLEKDNSETSIEEAIKNIILKSNHRVQIAEFIKYPTEENPNENCVSYVIDKTNCIKAVFSLSALEKFRIKEPNMPLTSLWGCFIILKKYNFIFDREFRQLQIYINDFDYISGQGQTHVYTGNLQSVNDIPSIKTFISVINSNIKENENKEVFHFGWNDINKISDEDCYISSEDRSILNNLPGWSDPDSPFLSQDNLNSNNGNLINQNDELFNSQSFFEIVDFNTIESNNQNEMNNNDQLNKKPEKRYRETISDDTNSSENEMKIEDNYNIKRIKVNDYVLDNQNLVFSQPIDSSHNTQDIYMETNSNFSDHLSSTTVENLTSNFAPAGKYNHSSHGSSSASDNTGSETEKESAVSNPFMNVGDRNKMAFDSKKLIEKASFFGQFNNSVDDNSDDEILYETQNFDNISSPNSNVFINNNWDTLNHFNMLSQNSSNDSDSNEINDNFQYMSKNSNIDSENLKSNNNTLSNQTNKTVNINIPHNKFISLFDTANFNNNVKINENKINHLLQESNQSLIEINNTKINDNIAINSQLKNNRNSNKKLNNQKQNDYILKDNHSIFNELDILIKNDYSGLIKSEFQKLYKKHMNIPSHERKNVNMDAMLKNLEKVISILYDISKLKGRKSKVSNKKKLSEAEKILNQLELNIKNETSEFNDTISIIESLRKYLVLLKNGNSSNNSSYLLSPLPSPIVSQSNSLSSSPNNSGSPSPSGKKKSIKKGQLKNSTSLSHLILSNDNENEKNDLLDDSLYKKNNKKNHEKSINEIISIVDDKSDVIDNEKKEILFSHIEEMLIQLDDNLTNSDNKNNKKKNENIDMHLAKTINSDSSMKESIDNLGINKNTEIYNTNNNNNQLISNSINNLKNKNDNSIIVTSNTLMKESPSHLYVNENIQVSNSNNDNQKLVNNTNNELKDKNGNSIIEENPISSLNNESIKKKGNSQEKKKKSSKRKAKNNEESINVNINELSISKRTKLSPRKTISYIEKENQQNITNSTMEDQELKKKRINEKEKNKEAIESNSPNKEDNSFLLYKRRLQEKKKKMQENNDRINDSFTRINEQEKIVNNHNTEQKTENKKEQNNRNQQEEILNSSSPIENNKNTTSESKTSDFGDKNNLTVTKSNINILNQSQNEHNTEENTIFSQSSDISNEGDKTPSLSPLRNITNVNSENVTPLRPTSILVKSRTTTGSSKKKSVSFSDSIQYRVIPSLPLTRRIPKVRSPKKSDNSVTSFFASIVSPPKSNKYSISPRNSSDIYINSSSPLNNKTIKKLNKTNSPFEFIKNNLFINDKSLRGNNDTIYSKDSGMLNRLGLNNFYKNHENKYIETSNKLNRLFTSPFNNSKERRIIPEISPSKNSLFISKNNILSNKNSSDIDNQDDNKNDNSINDKHQFTEFKSNTDVMEKIFLNDDHENVESNEKNYNDFTILKKLINHNQNTEVSDDDTLDKINDNEDQKKKQESNLDSSSNKIDVDDQTMKPNNINNIKNSVEPKCNQQILTEKITEDDDINVSDNKNDVENDNKNNVINNNENENENKNENENDNDYNVENINEKDEENGGDVDNNVGNDDYENDDENDNENNSENINDNDDDVDSENDDGNDNDPDEFINLSIYKNKITQKQHSLLSSEISAETMDNQVKNNGNEVVSINIDKENKEIKNINEDAIIFESQGNKNNDDYTIINGNNKVDEDFSLNNLSNCIEGKINDFKNDGVIHDTINNNDHKENANYNEILNKNTDLEKNVQNNLKKDSIIKNISDLSEKVNSNYKEKNEEVNNNKSITDNNEHQDDIPIVLDREKNIDNIEEININKNINTFDILDNMGFLSQAIDEDNLLSKHNIEKNDNNKMDDENEINQNININNYEKDITFTQDYNEDIESMPQSYNNLFFDDNNDFKSIDSIDIKSTIDENNVIEDKIIIGKEINIEKEYSTVEKEIIVDSSNVIIENENRIIEKQGIMDNKDNTIKKDNFVEKEIDKPIKEINIEKEIKSTNIKTNIEKEIFESGKDVEKENTTENEIVLNNFEITENQSNHKKENIIDNIMNIEPREQNEIEKNNAYQELTVEVELSEGSINLQDNEHINHEPLKLSNNDNKLKENIDKNTTNENNKHKTKTNKKMTKMEKLNEKEYENGLKYLKKNMNDNSYYQSMKRFYDTFTPSEENIKLFEFNMINHEESFSDCLCRNCYFCRSKIFNPTTTLNHLNIDYTNWKFY